MVRVFHKLAITLIDALFLSFFMKVNGIPTRTIWSVDHGQAIGIIDQTKLPFEFKKETLRDWRQVREAIAAMKVRGAPLIGIAAAWAMV